MKLFKKKLSKPVVYTMASCDYCDTLVKELNKANVSFVEKDIDKNRPEWEGVMKITGLPKTPTIFFNKNYLIPMRDFRNPDQLIKILDGLKDSDDNSSIQTTELLKTLNYNMSKAFNGLEITLKKLEENTASGHQTDNKIEEIVD